MMDVYGALGLMRTGKETEVLGGNPLQRHFFQPQMLHDLICGQTSAVEFGIQRLTA
jgi:hypothetical protein